MPYNKLVYCASPARLSKSKTAIMDFVVKRGMAPLHPFNALPIEYFENGVVDRQATLEICCKLVDICDEFWLFGISEGTLFETNYLFKNCKNKPLKICIEIFDPDHETYLNKYREVFSSTISTIEELAKHQA